MGQSFGCSCWKSWGSRPLGTWNKRLTCLSFLSKFAAVKIPQSDTVERKEARTRMLLIIPGHFMERMVCLLREMIYNNNNSIGKKKLGRDKIYCCDDDSLVSLSRRLLTEKSTRNRHTARKNLVLYLFLFHRRHNNCGMINTCQLYWCAGCCDTSGIWHVKRCKPDTSSGLGWSNVEGKNSSMPISSAACLSDLLLLMLE